MAATARGVIGGPQLLGLGSPLRQLSVVVSGMVHLSAVTVNVRNRPQTAQLWVLPKYVGRAVPRVAYSEGSGGGEIGFDHTRALL